MSSDFTFGYCLALTQFGTALVDISQSEVFDSAIIQIISQYGPVTDCMMSDITVYSNAL